MKPLRVWGRNCRTWRDFDVELPAGVTAIVGPNGAGKSTLLNSLEVALFGGRGELARWLTRDSGETTVEVGVVFEHDGSTYRVRRTAGKKVTLDFERAGTAEQEPGVDYATQAPIVYETLSRETMAATQQLIEDTLRLSRATFRSSAFLAQGDGAAFTEAQPRERKAILAEVLQLGVYDRLQALAKTDRASTETLLAQAVARAEELEGRVATRGTFELQKSAAGMNLERARMDVDDRERGLAELREQIASMRATSEQRTAAIADSDRIEAELRDVRSSLTLNESRLAEYEQQEQLRPAAETSAGRLPHARAALEDVTARLAALAERDGVAAALREAEQRQRSAEAEVDLAVAGVDATLRKAADILTTEKPCCPTCEQELPDAARAAVLADLKRQEKEAEERRDQAHERAVAAADQATALRARLEGMAADDSLVLLQAKKTSLDEEVRRGEAADRWLAAAGEAAKASALVSASVLQARQRVGVLEGELLAAQARVAEFAESANLTELIVRERAADVAVGEARAQVEVHVRAEATAQARLDELDVAARDLTEAAVDRTRLVAEAQVFKQLERAFGRDGIPALILENAALPFMESEASRLAAELGRPYRFELRTQRAKQDGGIAEALDIVVHTSTGEALYEDFSGGERTRIDLALRIALARLLASRAGAEVRMLAVDEPGFLDEDGMERLAAVLRQLPEFEKVLVVSHVAELRDAFDTSMVVAGGGETGEPSRLVGAAVMEEVAA